MQLDNKVFLIALQQHSQARIHPSQKASALTVALLQ
jgi:hypothetical protein